MNRVAESIIPFPVVKLLIVGVAWLLLVACSTQSEPPTATPEIRVLGELSTKAALTATPRPSLTPSPTALPSRTPFPTPRQVTVSRAREDIDPRFVTPIAPDMPLPDLILTDIDGHEIRLRDFAEQNSRPLVLNFWSLGCGSCFYEFPVLQDFYAAHGADNLAVIGINIADFPEETRLVGEQLGIDFPLVVDHQAGFFTRYFNGAVVPTTIFITAEGEVLEVVTGALDAFNIDLRLQQLGLPTVADS